MLAVILFFLTISGLVKFFGQLAYLYPEDLTSSLQAFLNILYSLIEGQDVSQRLIAVETLGFIGSSDKGKQILMKNGKRHTGFILY